MIKLSSAINSFIKHSGLYDKIILLRIKKYLSKELSFEMLEKHLYIKDFSKGILTLQPKNSSLKFYLKINQEKMKNKINEFLGENAIYHIKIL